jgi:hypothetical protein
LDELERCRPIVEIFLAGRMPRMSHARHLALGNLLRRWPDGYALMHEGLRQTAIRAGVPEKYSRAITDAYWAALDGPLPPLEDFAHALAFG